MAAEVMPLAFGDGCERMQVDVELATPSDEANDGGHCAPLEPIIINNLPPDTKRKDLIAG
ncbi:MAG TPA: hypothetical protein VGI36_20185 [Candidatus Binataceae bacterium]|jgi:hypothetical protein